MVYSMDSRLRGNDRTREGRSLANDTSTKRKPIADNRDNLYRYCRLQLRTRVISWKFVEEISPRGGRRIVAHRE